MHLQHYSICCKRCQAALLAQAAWATSAACVVIEQLEQRCINVKDDQYSYAKCS